MKPVRLEMGKHWEVLRFIVVPAMTESMILGLAWLDKWGSTIWWEGAYRKIKIRVSPRPPPHEQAQRGDDIREEGIPMEGQTAAAAPFPRSMQTWQRSLVRGSVICYHHHHHPTNCAIKIIPGAKLLKLKMFSMMPRKMEELH